MDDIRKTIQECPSFMEIQYLNRLPLVSKLMCIFNHKVDGRYLIATLEEYLPSRLKTSEYSI